MQYLRYLRLFNAILKYHLTFHLVLDFNVVTSFCDFFFQVDLNNFSSKFNIVSWQFFRKHFPNSSEAISFRILNEDYNASTQVIFS